MTAPNNTRLTLLNEAADPFVLRYHLYENGTGPLFLSQKDDLESAFHLQPSDNFQIQDLVSEPNANYLITAENIHLLTQSDEILLAAIKADRQRALDFLKEQAPKDKLFDILSQIDPKIKHYSIDGIVRRYSSYIFTPSDTPLSIESIISNISKITAKEGHDLLKPSEYMSFFENLKAFLLGIVVLTVSKLTSISIKAGQNQAKKEGLTEAQYIVKNFCKKYPKQELL